MERSVYVGPEFDAVFSYLSQRRETEDLKSTAIGEDGTAPVDEFMKSAHLVDDFMAGAQIEMISIAQDDLGADLAQFVGRHGFHRPLGTYRHECRGLYSSPGSYEPACAGRSVTFLEFNLHSVYYSRLARREKRRSQKAYHIKTWNYRQISILFSNMCTGRRTEKIMASPVFFYLNFNERIALTECPIFDIIFET